MTLRDMLPASVAIHHDYESLEIEPEDWEEENGKIILDMRRIKDGRERKRL